MKSEFCSSPPDPTPPNRTLSVLTLCRLTLCRRTWSSRAFRATCVARCGEVAPGPSCSPKSGDRAPASDNPSGFGQYIRPRLGLLDDALEPPDFRAGAASTRRAATGFPWSSTTSLHDPGSSSSTCARSLPSSRWQLSTLTRHEERKPLVQFDVRGAGILGLQNSPFSPWSPSLRSAFAARRRAATSATTSSPAAATSSGLAVDGRRLQKMTSGVARRRTRWVRLAKRTGCVSY
jgi:hypothetical protein